MVLIARLLRQEKIIFGRASRSQLKKSPVPAHNHKGCAGRGPNFLRILKCAQYAKHAKYAKYAQYAKCTPRGESQTKQNW